MRNNFTKGVAALQEAFNITQEECQELVRNMKFPLTEDLLIAAIRLISPLNLGKLLNGQYARFDPSVNDDTILKALVHAVHHREMDHAEVLFNSQCIRPYFLPYATRLLRPYIDHSCKNFDDASFVKFMVKIQPENITLFFGSFWEYFKTYHRTNALFQLYHIAPRLFNYYLYCARHESPHFILQVKPEKLFVILQDCSVDILPCISDASWEQFASTPYKDDAVKCLLRKYCCPEENVSVSACAYWEKFALKFNAYRKSLDQDLPLENETFLLVFIKYFCNQYSRFRKFANNNPFLFESMRDKILALCSRLQDQSYLPYLEEIGFAPSNCSIL